jgi:hypothetical protein
MAAKGKKVDQSGAIPVIESRRLPPDPGMFTALAALGYTLPEALADLVDNCVDAAACNILIRIVKSSGRPSQLLVVDDGKGITDGDIDNCMTVGGSRDYGTEALGIFGMGLKTASFSMAGSLAVLSRAARKKATGRMWVPEKAKQDWICDVVDPNYARVELDRDWTPVSTSSSGTIVRWDAVKDFERPIGDVNRYLAKIIDQVDKHLGLLFHRFLERKQICIRIDVLDLDSGDISIPRDVTPLNPFLYPATGDRAYPKQLILDGASGLGHVPMAAHIWPPRSKAPGYRLGGGAVSSRQGFYFYRSDRLVQAGGWNGFRDTEPHTSLARIAVELEPPYDTLFQLTVKKSGVEVPQSFFSALPNAVSSDGTTWPKYLEAAERVYRTSAKAEKVPRLAPGRGLPARLQKAVGKALAVGKRAEVFDILWKQLPKEQFFHIDHDESTLYLNQRYRSAVLGERASSLADAPLVKTLLFLLLQDHLEAERMGARLKDSQEAWQESLVAAARQQGAK